MKSYKTFEGELSFDTARKELNRLSSQLLTITEEGLTCNIFAELSLRMRIKSMQSLQDLLLKYLAQGEVITK